MTAATACTSVQTRRQVAVILRGIKDCHEVRIKTIANSQFWKISLSTKCGNMFLEVVHFSGKRFIYQDLLLRR
jgi:hypothetical protein